MSFFTKKVGCCCCVCFPKIFVGIFYILSIQQYWRSSIYTTTQLLQPVPAFLADLFMFFLRSRATAAAIHSASKLLDTQYTGYIVRSYTTLYTTSKSTLRGRTSTADRGPSCACLLYTIYTALSSAICLQQQYSILLLYYTEKQKKRQGRLLRRPQPHHLHYCQNRDLEVLWPVSRLLAFFGSWPSLYQFLSSLDLFPESVTTYTQIFSDGFMLWLV